MSAIHEPRCRAARCSCRRRRACRQLLASRRASWAAGSRAAGRQPPRLPGSLRSTPMLDAWIRIDADGTITVFTGKAELGQGIKTALMQVAAEELGVEPDAIDARHRGYRRARPTRATRPAASRCRTARTAIRNAAAQVRELLLAQPAARLGVPAEQLTAKTAPSIAARRPQRRLWRARRGRDAARARRNRNRTLKRARRAYRVMGKPVPRVDIPAKVTGGVAYVQDLRLPGMVHARVVRPPSYGARLRSVEARRVETHAGRAQGRARRQFPRRRRRARIPGGQGHATRSPTASRGTRARLCPSPARSVRLAAQRCRRRTRHSRQRRQRRQPRRGRSRPYTTRPYQMHASIGPSCAVRRCEDGAPDGMDAQPGRLSVARRDSPRCWACRTEQRALHPHGGLRLLRPQRRRRRRRRCRADRARRCRAGRCACNGCASRSTPGSRIGAGHGGAARAPSRCAAATSSTGTTRSGATPIRRARAAPAI